MSEPKISLVLTLPGRFKASQQEAENKPTAKQVLKMSEEAYKEMLITPTSTKYKKPVGKTKKGDVVRAWDNMSEDIRIKKHCELIAYDLHAISFDYFILGE